ncbi:MAG: alpha/beta fold hydrolase [Oceanicaulis sp.]
MMKVLLVIAVALAVIIAGALVWLWTPDLPRDRLEAAYLRSSADMIEVEGARLHVRVDGPETAPAVILMHGFGSSLHTFEAWAQALSDRYRVIRFDLPGAGLSPPDPTGRYDDERLHQILTGLMDRLGVEAAVIGGNSVGGRIAWSFAAAHPERTAGLVLIAPDGFASAGFEYGKAPEVGPVTHAMRAVTPRFLVKMNLDQSYGDPSRLSPETVKRYHDLLRAPGARLALIRRMEQTVLEDPRPRLETITAPTLLLWGEEDRLIPISNAQDYLDHLPNARLEALSGIGHLPQEEAPEVSLVPLEAFLQSLEAQP